MRRSFQLLRGAKGHGWYRQFKKHGQESFQKHKPPPPFNWDEMCPVGEILIGRPIQSRPKVYFDISVDNDPAGRLEFELASDVVSIYSNIF